MIRTNTETPAKPDVAMIIKGVLKGYFTDTDGILEMARAEKSAFTSRLLAQNPMYPEDFVNLVSLVAALYAVVNKTETKERSLSVVMASFLPAGLAMQFGNFRFVEDERTFGNLVKYQQRTNREGPTRMNRMEVLRQDESAYEFHVHNCMFREAFAGLGFPELTAVMCAIDNVAFNSYLPDEVHFHRESKEKTIYQGNSYCSFQCEKGSRA